MIKKLMSLAAAICMIATALTAVSVAAVEITGDILPYDTGGNPKSVFFTGERVCFSLEYKLDGYYAGGAWFRVQLVDIAGNDLDTPVNVMTPYTDIPYRSWPGVGFDIPWGQDPGTYYLKAWFSNTSQLMFTNTVKVLQQGIVLTPEQPSYAPGQTMKIDVTLNYDDDINVTIEKDGQIFKKWSDESLVNYMWNDTWTIPSDAPTGWYMIQVNRSVDNVTMLTAWVLVEFFTFDISTDKGSYLPGETAVITWMVRSIPDMLPMSVAIDFNMSYTDGLSGLPKWQNGTFTTNPFSVVLPAYADVDDNIWVEATAHTTYNQTSERSFWIDLDGLAADIWTDMGAYSPGEDVIVTVQATVAGSPVQDANASVVAYDEDGQLVSGMAMSNLITGRTGVATGIIVVPADIEPGDIILVVTMTKLGYIASDSTTITIDDNLQIDVLVPKTMYVAGENIDVKLNVWRNGVAVMPESVEYWLELSVGVRYPHETTTETNFTIVAPSGINSDAWVWVRIVIDGETHDASSDSFWITPLALALGVNKAYYYAGDTLTFRVDVLGDWTPFDFSYSIWDDDSVTVDSDDLTIGTDGSAKFTLAIPSDRPSSSYTARVIADNHAGFVLGDALIVNWIGDYVLDVWIKTGPAYASGGFAPGQTVTVGFEITKSSEDLPDLTAVYATVSLYEGEPQYLSDWWWSEWTYGPHVATGESRMFEGMSGELSIVLPGEISSGKYSIVVGVEGMEAVEVISVNADGNGWDSSVGGLSAADLMMTILMIIVILMLLWMMIKGGAAASLGLGAKKPEAPKEAPPKQEQYAPKSTVKCPACGGPIEVATSKRPIEVMCPKCGTSQIIN